MKPICQLYSNDGFDCDVLFNVVIQYQRVGYLVFWGDTVKPVDLLVVLRGSDIEFGENINKKMKIHLFDYVGYYENYYKMISALSKFDVTIFTTNRESNYSAFSNVTSIIFSPPPVPVNYWTKRIVKTPKFGTVHIGNRKPLIKDIRQQMLDRLVLNGDIHIWGRNWTLGTNSKFHGSLNVFSIKRIYSRTKVAVGIMYDYQRKKTFSGRFWQAPLNGCLLFSESGWNSAPGIIESNNLEISYLTNYANDFSKRVIIQSEAIKYWQGLQKDLENILIENFVVSHAPFTNYILYKTLRTILWSVIKRMELYYSNFYPSFLASKKYTE